MCFVSKQEEKAIIKVPGAYMFTICPKVEQELKACRRYLLTLRPRKF